MSPVASPFPFKPVPEEYRYGVHRYQEREEYKDGGRCSADKTSLWAIGPNEDLGWQRGRAGERAFRRGRDEGVHPYQEEGRSFPQRLRHADDRAGENAWHRQRQNVAEHRLLG